jgi:hypothetical protein
VAAWSETWVCGRSIARVVGSNPAESMDVVSLANAVCCPDDHSSIEDMPRVVYLNVIVKSQQRRGPVTLGAAEPWGSKLH